MAEITSNEQERRTEECVYREAVITPCSDGSAEWQTLEPGAEWPGGVEAVREYLRRAGAQGVNLYHLGHDDLPEDLEQRRGRVYRLRAGEDKKADRSLDIRGRIRDEPEEVVLMVGRHNWHGLLGHYFGLRRSDGTKGG